MTNPVIRSILVLAYLKVALSFVILDNINTNRNFKFGTELKVVPESTFSGDRTPVSFNPDRKTEQNE